MQIFDQLEKVVIDLALVAFRNLFLLFSIYVDLGTEHCLAIGSTACELVQGSCWDLGWDHCPICCLLLYRNDNLTVLAWLWVHLRATNIVCLVRGMWRCVQIRVSLESGLLVLHLELGEEGLLELGLLRRAYRLPWHLLLYVELVE